MVSFVNPNSAKVQPATRLSEKDLASQVPVKEEMTPVQEAVELWIRREEKEGGLEFNSRHLRYCGACRWSERRSCEIDPFDCVVVNVDTTADGHRTSIVELIGRHFVRESIFSLTMIIQMSTRIQENTWLPSRYKSLTSTCPHSSSRATLILLPLPFSLTTHDLALHLQNNLHATLSHVPLSTL